MIVWSYLMPILKWWQRPSSALLSVTHKNPYHTVELGRSSSHLRPVAFLICGHPLAVLRPQAVQAMNRSHQHYQVSTNITSSDTKPVLTYALPCPERLSRARVLSGCGLETFTVRTCYVLSNESSPPAGYLISCTSELWSWSESSSELNGTVGMVWGLIP